MTSKTASSAPIPSDAQRAIESLLAGRTNFIQEHLQRLRALPAHGNRKLREHQLFIALLLAFYDPLIRSLRLIEDEGSFDGRIDLPRLARSTTSDALAMLDPVCLRPLIKDLCQRVPHLAQEEDLSTITRQIIAADGTYFTTIVDTAWALHHTKSNGKKQAQVRANVQMDVATWTPQVITVSGDDHCSEADAFTPDLLTGVLYVVDRNFLNFSFIREALAKDNDLVLRIKSNAPLARVLETRELTLADIEAGVIADETVELTGRDAPEGSFRRVSILTTSRKGETETILLLSSLTDPSIAARVIGAIYRLRWQIELFFKWLKTYANLDRFLSTTRNGITFQLYVVMIGVLLMYLQSGRRVSVYALAALRRLSRGQCTLQEAMKVIAKREREREMNRARQAARRARKKLA